MQNLHQKPAPRTTVPRTEAAESKMMKTRSLLTVFAFASILAVSPAPAGQAPFGLLAPDIPVSSRDRVYTADQFSNTVSVVNPSSNSLVGVIRLGELQPQNFSPLYRGQVLVHGMGFSPDRRTLAVVSIGSNSVTFIDTATNAIKHITYVGRAPHEAFFTPDGKEVWVSVRGQDYIAVLDAQTYAEKLQIKLPPGPGMTIFSPDGRYGYVCSSFTPEMTVISVADHAIVATIKQQSPFCPDIAATPDGRQVWFTQKDLGKTVVFDARPPFTVLKVLDTGPLTNHVNFAFNKKGKFAYVTQGGDNHVAVFNIEDFTEVARIAVGDLPHGIWPSGDGTRVYVGLENDNAVTAIDALTQKVMATIPVGQAPQALIYVPGAVPDGDGTSNLVPLGKLGEAASLKLSPPSASNTIAHSTNVAIFEQGLAQILQASVAGLEPRQPYVIALAARRDGTGTLEPLAEFVTNQAGAAVVQAVGQIRTLVLTAKPGDQRYLVIVPRTSNGLGAPAQIQSN